MEENQLLVLDTKENARDPGRQFAPNLSNTGPEVVDERHPEWPPKLHRHDVLTDNLSFSSW